MPAQPQFPNFTFDVTAMSVTEPAPAWSPATIIARDVAFTLSSDFHMIGTTGQHIQDALSGTTMVNEYIIRYTAESIGPGPEYKFPLAPAPNDWKHVTCILGNYYYDKTQTNYTVPANTMDPGLYRLGCIVKMVQITGGSTLGVTGFVEGPTIEIYEP
jgi:hypothetical protein